MKLTVQTIDYILNPGITAKNDEVVKNFLSIMVTFLGKQKHYFEEVKQKIKLLKQCYDFEPTLNYSVGKDNANTPEMVEGYEKRNTI